MSTKPTTRTRAEYDAQRSAATRARILDAALETLLDVGYAKTTTVEIGRRAGVARGTLLHHFPDRESLMVAAVRHVFERRLAEFEQQVDALGLLDDPHGAPDTDALIELLWRAIDGGTTLAWVELVVATRNDAVLRAELIRLMEEFDERIAERYVRFLPRAAGAEPPRRLVFALMNGLVLDRMSGRDAHVPAVLTLLKVATRMTGLGG
ncbi:MAG: TetR/AcrR family transcriptional regulator [Sandaracinaceae bacterium]|nr:TetR/AcrR family transcriptional regulator [Sandaracinaceae bacterium]